MTSQLGLETIVIHIFTNISRSKDNQAMEFGQLTEYNMRNIFLVKSYTKCGRETNSRSFSKNQNWAYLWINILKFYIFCFNCLPSWDLSKVIETKLQIICFYLIKALLRNKKRSETSLPASFSAWFLKKNISVVTFYYLTKFQCLVVFTSWDIGQYVPCNCLLTRLWRQKFWN